VPAPFRTFVGQGAWYAIGNVLIKISGLLLLPVYTNTRYLGVEEYGLWGVLEVTVQLGVTMFSLQLASGVVRFYVDPKYRNDLIPTAWWMTVCCTAAGGLAAAAAMHVFVAREFHTIGYLLIVYTIFEICTTIPLAQLRAQERAKYFTALLVIKLCLIVALNLVLLIHVRLGLEGLLLSYTVASACTLAIAFITIARNLVGFDRTIARMLLGFSTPLILGGLGSMILNVSGRYVIVLFHSAEEVALYTLASKFGSVVNMLIVQPLNLALLPVLVSLSQRQRIDFMKKTVYYFSIVLAAAVIVVSLFTEPLLRLFNPDDAYYEGLSMVPFIAGGYAAFGLSRVFSSPLYVFKKTRVISAWLTGIALLNILIGVMLVPFIGPMGAALSLFVSYGILCIGQYRAIAKIEYIVYPWKRLFAVFGFAAAAIAPAYAVSFEVPAYDLAFRALLAAGWAGFLVLSRIVTSADAAAFRQWISGRDR
jgi:O-antigen/teichoic acid export membrane protein